MGVILLLLVPRTEALALLNCQEEQRRKPTSICIYATILAIRTFIKAVCNACLLNNTYSVGVIVALCLTIVFSELPDSCTSSTKRQVTPFLYIGSRFFAHPKVGFKQENGAKLSISFQNAQEKMKKLFEVSSFYGFRG